MPSKKNLYSVHPSVWMVQNWMNTLPEKTGRSLDEWITIIKKSGPATNKERQAWLKKKHKLGTNSAVWLAARAEGRGFEDGDPEQYLKTAERYVNEMFSGSKENLRPIYDAIVGTWLNLGKDVRICPCKTIVPLYRNHVIAQIKPSTRTRIDLGFALGNTKATRRLVDTGGYAKKDRITHKIGIESVNDLDAEVTKWLTTAYNMDA